MKAGVLDIAALAASCETELGVEVERSAPARGFRPATGDSGWSIVKCARSAGRFPGSRVTRMMRWGKTWPESWMIVWRAGRRRLATEKTVT